MADSDKKEKIAAARKRLKQFKNKSSVPSGKQRDINNKASPTLPASPASPKEGEVNSQRESLHQISQQINGLLREAMPTNDANHSYESSDVSQLEARNRELAAMSEKLSQANKQLTAQVQQMRGHLEGMQQQISRERQQIEEKQKKDTATLKEQLQVHIQTIGILVAEKTELQSQLSQSQKTGQERLEELEELDGRLKASRQRVSDLERNLSASNSTSHQHEKAIKDLSKDVDRLKTDLYKSNKSHEETQQMYSELHEKLNKKLSECSELEQKLDETSRELERSQLYAQQLSSQTDVNTDNLKQIDKLQQERDDLSSRLHQYDEAFQKEQREKTQITQQYQEYMQQLQNQSQQLSQQVKLLTEERETLLTKQHVLERQMNQLNNDLDDANSSRSNNDHLRDQFTKLTNDHNELDMAHSDLARRMEGQIIDNQQLSRLLQEREATISQLEREVAKLGQDTSDHQQLLDSVHSDKTALSRAISQNKELKTQLSELQNGFVKMSNDNMEMMTRLTSEQHTSKELSTRLVHQEEQIGDLERKLLQKDSEIDLARKESSHQTTKDGYQQEQMADRLRHYEAQAQLVETLQNELESSQGMVHALTAQNSDLRKMLIDTSSSQSRPQSDDVADDKREAIIDSLSGAIRQLEAERNQLMSQLNEQRALSDGLTVKLTDAEQQIIRYKDFSAHDSNSNIPKLDYETMERAMHMIEMKYTEAMKDKAELSDRAEELEYLVTQLQGEADTIGEYISLYHHQRALLQQREYQKNEYITQLASDREQLQSKLGELQGLVMQMMGERRMLESYNMESGMKSPHGDTHRAHIQNIANGGKDWPDYTSSSGSESEVEEIAIDPQSADDGQSADGRQSADDTPHADVSATAIPRSVHKGPSTLERDGVKTPAESTASKILHLLDEIGHSNYTTDHQYDNSIHIMHCKFCTGRVQIL